MCGAYMCGVHMCVVCTYVVCTCVWCVCAYDSIWTAIIVGAKMLDNSTQDVGQISKS